MTELRQGNGRHIEQEWTVNAKRIPRLYSYQTKGQLPLTLMSLVIIFTAVFVYWIFTVYGTWRGMTRHGIERKRSKWQ